MALTISVQPSDVASVDGTSYAFTITVTGAVGTIVYTWTEYTDATRSDPTPIGTNSSTLTIAAPGNVGISKWYDCVVKDDETSVTSDLVSKVPIPEAGTVTPTDPSVHDCANVVFTGTAINNGVDNAIYVKWFEDDGVGLPQPITTWVIVTPDSPGENYTHGIVVVSTGKDGYTYQMRTSYDQFNSDTTGITTLTVTNARASLRAHPVTVDVGDPVTLAWFVSSCSSVTFAWLKGVTTIAGETSDTLTFPSVAASDASSYTIKATNTAGTVTATSTLTVNDPATDPGGGRRRFFVGNQAY